MIGDLKKDEAVRAAIDAVTSQGTTAPLGHGAVEELLARVAWSVLAEPGDGVAGALIAELGARDALSVVLESSTALAGAGRSGRALAEGLARWQPRARVEDVAAAILGARDVDARLVIPGTPWWPSALDDLEQHAPIALWVRGDVRLLSARPRVAIVGARAASAYGEQVAGELAGDVAAQGAVVVSGGAYGIDGAAHRAALAVDGATVAFLAGGVDRAYPQGHAQLLRRIADVGAVVSEVPCGTAPTKWRFLARNRLIAALSEATVVVEAGWRSGSLNTAGHAASLGRPLGAVPGPVTSASSAGCHRLLREYDARCVTTPAEVRELWGAHVDSTIPSGRSAEETRLLDAVGTRTAIPVREVARRSGLSPERVSALLGLLELEGEVTRAEGGWVRTAERGSAR